MKIGSSLAAQTSLFSNLFTSTKPKMQQQAASFAEKVDGKASDRVTLSVTGTESSVTLSALPSVSFQTTQGKEKQPVVSEAAAAYLNPEEIAFFENLLGDSGGNYTVNGQLAPVESGFQSIALRI